MQLGGDKANKWWQPDFGLDLRSLALLRFGIGLYTVADACQRLLEVRQYYTGYGVLPAAATSAAKNRWLWSFHLFSDAVWWQVLLIALVIAAGFTLAVGYRTTLANVVTWALTVSLNNRNELVLDGGDIVHRLLLFWCMFVPLGAVWSIDASRRPLPSGHAAKLTTLSTAALKIQMALTFVVAALLKTDASWRKTFDATWIALQYDVYTTWFGIWLRQFPEFLRYLTMATLAIEAVAPLLLFVPYAPVQVLAILMLVALHLGFVACLHLIMFSGIMILGWLVFTPGWAWDRLKVPLEAPAAWRERFRWPGAAEADPWRYRSPLATHVFVGACLAYVLVWNVRTVDFKRFERIFPTKLNFIGYLLRIDQHWNMFAPSPVKEDGWLLAPARLAGGFEVDLLRDGAPVLWDRPDSISDTYVNRRGRKYYWAVTSVDNEETRKQFARYLCRVGSERLGEPILSVDIVMVKEVVQPDRTVSPPSRVMLWQQKCR